MGYVKLDRQLMNWEWKDKPNMVALWVEILLQANYQDRSWHGEEYEVGTFPTSLAKLSKNTGLTVQQVRTCINRLKSTNEITCVSTSKGMKISVVKWAEYQGEGAGINKQINTLGNTLATNDQQAFNNTIRSKEIKKVKKDREEIYKDIEKLGSLGLVEEADRLTKLAQDNGLDWRTYKAICDAMFNPYIIDKDKYIETVLKGNQ